MLITFCHLIVRIFFREIVFEGAPPDAESIIFAANHPNSLLDPLLLQLLNPPFRIRFVAKAPLFQIPLFGTILRRVGAIPVVRKFEAAGEVDYSQFFSACLRALQSGDCVAIFPEGRSLPQPFLAPMKTGPARLFFMAQEKGVDAKIVPIGLNYERGTVFRSSVLIAIGQPLETDKFLRQHSSGPNAAVHSLTAEIGRALSEHLFQAGTFRDRELMLLLERLSSERAADSWPDRLIRLKQFEAALAALREKCPADIENLRRLLSRYQRLSSTFGVEIDSSDKPAGRFSVIQWLGSVAGLLFASTGIIFNWVPYRLVDFIVKQRKDDESTAATTKIVASIFAFPITYLIEAIAIGHFAGWIAALIFASIIFPLSYFTLLFFEWRDEQSSQTQKRSAWLSGNIALRVEKQLTRLRNRILAEVERLASVIQAQG